MFGQFISKVKKHGKKDGKEKKSRFWKSGSDKSAEETIELETGKDGDKSTPGAAGSAFQTTSEMNLVKKQEAVERAREALERSLKEAQQALEQSLAEKTINDVRTEAENAPLQPLFKTEDTHKYDDDKVTAARYENKYPDVISVKAPGEPSDGDHYSRQSSLQSSTEGGSVSVFWDENDDNDLISDLGNAVRGSPGKASEDEQQHNKQAPDKATMPNKEQKSPKDEDKDFPTDRSVDSEQTPGQMSGTFERQDSLTDEGKATDQIAKLDEKQTSTCLEDTDSPVDRGIDAPGQTSTADEKESPTKDEKEKKAKKAHAQSLMTGELKVIASDEKPPPSKADAKGALDAAVVLDEKKSDRVLTAGQRRAEELALAAKRSKEAVKESAEAEKKEAEEVAFAAEQKREAEKRQAEELAKEAERKREAEKRKAVEIALAAEREREAERRKAEAEKRKAVEIALAAEREREAERRKAEAEKRAADAERRKAIAQRRREEAEKAREEASKTKEEMKVIREAAERSLEAAQNDVEAATDALELSITEAQYALAHARTEQKIAEDEFIRMSREEEEAKEIYEKNNSSVEMFVKRSLSHYYTVATKRKKKATRIKDAAQTAVEKAREAFVYALREALAKVDAAIAAKETAEDDLEVSCRKEEEAMRALEESKKSLEAIDTDDSDETPSVSDGTTTYVFDDDEEEQRPHQMFGMFDTQKYLEEMEMACTASDSEDDISVSVYNNTDQNVTAEEKEEDVDLVRKFETDGLLQMPLEKAKEYLKKMEESMNKKGTSSKAKRASPEKKDDHFTSFLDLPSDVNGVYDFRAKVEEDYLIKTFTGHAIRVCSVAVFSKELFLSGCDDGSIKAWNLSSGRCLRTFRGHSDSVYSVAAVDENRFLSTSNDKTVKLWDFTKGKCIRTFEGHTDRVTSVTAIGRERLKVDADADDLCISGSYDNTIKLWDMSTGECLKTFKGYARVNAVAALGNGRFISGSDDSTIRLWSLSMRKCIRKFTHASAFSFAVVDENRFLSGSLDRSIKLWDAMLGECICTFEGHFGGVWSLASMGNNKVVSGSSDGTIKVWDLSLKKCTQTFETSGVVTAVAAAGNEIISAGSLDGAIFLWKSNDLGEF